MGADTSATVVEARSKIDGYVLWLITAHGPQGLEPTPFFSALSKVGWVFSGKAFADYLKEAEIPETWLVPAYDLLIETALTLMGLPNPSLFVPPTQYQRLLDSFSTFPNSAYKSVCTKIERQILEYIEGQILATARVRQENPGTALSSGHSLYGFFSPYVQFFYENSGLGGPAFELVADRAAFEMCQCSNDFYNHRIKSSPLTLDEARDSMSLENEALQSAQTTQRKEGIQQSIQVSREIIQNLEAEARDEERNRQLRERGQVVSVRVSTSGEFSYNYLDRCVCCLGPAQQKTTTGFWTGMLEFPICDICKEHAQAVILSAGRKRRGIACLVVIMVVGFFLLGTAKVPVAIGLTVVGGVLSILYYLSQKFGVLKIEQMLAQVPYGPPRLGLPEHGRPNVFSAAFSKMAI